MWKFQKEVIEFRAAHGLNFQQCATLFKFSALSISKWEKGTSRSTEKNRAKVRRKMRSIGMPKLITAEQQKENREALFDNPDINLAQSEAADTKFFNGKTEDILRTGLKVAHEQGLFEDPVEKFISSILTLTQ